ncbi:MAG: hypothetical protein CBD26_04125 [Candidatus Pelagibacter sp. TMED166]|nr:MAG: hypothetical protein CBD26_04125 [Candidatus Pelagibacter sp. TMED166]|tara:strand:- start:1714 stop:2745 length:1032 start_codon:yes stop_codon:yes gene_type:complete
MKNFIFICSILIILFKTGNVLSDNNIFNVNNIEISKDISKNKQKLANLAFQEGFKELTSRLLLEEDYKRISATNLIEIKKLISYYQIKNDENNSNISFNLFFDRDRIHNFFYQRNILYSDIINTNIIVFPLLIKDKQNFIYTKNYFYENWNNEDSKESIQYTLPVESVESIQKIKMNKENIYKLNIQDFFKEYNLENMAFIAIEIEDNSAKVFLNSKIEGKKLNKNLLINNTNLRENQFNDKIILEIKNVLKDLIKSQNLIDVRTPSFLNVEIKLNSKDNLVEFNNRLKKIDLIDNFYVQQLNKDFVLVKIKYLGKINKIIKKLKDQNIDLKMKDGQWKINII